MGPFETENEAIEAALDATGSTTGPDVNLTMLTVACADAGVTLGAYDVHILRWLANYGPQTCAVVAGLIERAHTTERADD